MAKVPQRDINLANKLLNVAQSGIGIAQALLDPASIVLSDDWHSQLEGALFDALSAVREHKHKLSNIQLKGQRG